MKLSRRAQKFLNQPTTVLGLQVGRSSDGSFGGATEQTVNSLVRNGVIVPTFSSVVLKPNEIYLEKHYHKT